MPVVAVISISRFKDVCETLGFSPRSDDPRIFERQEDHLMLFPDVRDGQVTLIDIFMQIEKWGADEGLADRFLETLYEMGGLYE